MQILFLPVFFNSKSKPTIYTSQKDTKDITKLQLIYKFRNIS